MKSIMNISFKSYIDIFNFISKVFSLTMLEKEPLLYRYENLITHNYELPIKEPYELKKRYVFKINDLSDNYCNNKYDDAVINIIIYRVKDEMCPPPIVSLSRPLFSDKDMDINILVESRFFLNKTFEGYPNTSVVPDRASYLKIILSALSNIFINEDLAFMDDQIEETATILNNINSVLAYCVFTDIVVDKDIRKVSSHIIDYVCAQGCDYINITDANKAYSILGECYNRRPSAITIDVGTTDSES